MSEEINDVIDNLGKSFEDFKSENQKNIDEIKKNGVADPILQAKVDKLADDVATKAELKQDAELKEQGLEDAKKRLDALETKLARP